ncbi:MAG: hypothetical protein L3K07_07630 [Thermoplasmata archaeon]|nr:hypothetical protein [Thermoplasmata archaeon]
MRSKYVALMTGDPALYAELASLLREYRFPTVSLLPGQRVPDRVAVVLTSTGEIPKIAHPKVLGASHGADRASLLAALRSALGKDAPDSGFVVGIDPGPTPGYSVLAGDAVLAEGIIAAPEATAKFANELLERFPARPFLFRVGLGDRVARTRIVNALWKVSHNIELVDEHGTTPRGHRRPRDAVAARRIASLPGRPVHGTEELRIRPGEIANLQRESRISSGGTHTIPRSLAVRVLEGSLSLADAVEASRPDPRARGAHGASRGQRY